MIAEEIISERLTHGMLEEDEIRALADGILNFKWSPNDIAVEVGVWKGWTTVMMGKLMAAMQLPCLVVGIDAFERVAPSTYTKTEGYRLSSTGNCRGFYQLAIERVMAAGLGTQVLLVSANSTQAEGIIPPRVGVLVIDGWHSFEQTKIDLMAYVPKLLPGGFCLVDDYCDFYPGVVQAVDWFLENYGEVTLEQKFNKGVGLRKK